MCTKFRRVLLDNLLNGTAREIKSGRIELIDAFKKQIRKDLEIIKQQITLDIKKIEWHALGDIDPAALKFIKEEMVRLGVADELFKVIIY